MALSRLMLVRSQNILTWLCIGLFLSFSLAACSTNSGIFGGGSWQANGLQHQHIRALAVNADDPKIIYAGSEQGEVFLSTDAGQHWSSHSTALPPSNTIHQLLFDSGLKFVLAATDKGIFVSNASLQQWHMLPAKGLPVDSYTALDFNANTPKDLYAGTAHHGVFVSTDGGNTWSVENDGLPAGSVINGLTFDASKHQLWAATTAGVYLLSGGQSWKALNDGIAQGSVPYAVLPASASGGDQHLVYLGTDHGFYRSTDDGAHWQMNKEGIAGVNIYQILVDFRNNSSGETLYIATNRGVFLSSDGGQTWGSSGSGWPQDQAVYALAFGADNYAQLYAGSDGVYQYPGNSSGFNSSRILLFLAMVIFFFLLYRMTQRNRMRRWGTPLPKAPEQAPPDGSEPKK
jgi:photosystem II stability/assembly factor-like uncharacterized protein